MGARVPSKASIFVGLALIVAGEGYSFAPIFCSHSMSRQRTALTAVAVLPYPTQCGELSLRLLSRFEVAPIGNALVLGLCYLPLLSAVVGVGCGIIYLIWARRAFAVWSIGALIAGGAALCLMLPLLLLLPFRPQTGYLGMLVGYGLLWAGNRLLLRAPPQARVVA